MEHRMILRAAVLFILLCAGVACSYAQSFPGEQPIQAITGNPAPGSVPIASSATSAAWGTDLVKTSPPASFTTPAWTFNDLATTGFDFSDSSTHFGVVITGNTPATGGGSYNAFITQQYSDCRSSSAYATGAEFQSIVTRGGGNITGSNPVVIVCGTAVIPGQCPFGTPATPHSVVGEEIDIFAFLGA